MNELFGLNIFYVLSKSNQMHMFLSEILTIQKMRWRGFLCEILPSKDGLFIKYFEEISATYDCDKMYLHSLCFSIARRHKKTLHYLFNNKRCNENK